MHEVNFLSISTSVGKTHAGKRQECRIFHWVCVISGCNLGLLIEDGHKEHLTDNPLHEIDIHPLRCIIGICPLDPALGNQASFFSNEQ